MQSIETTLRPALLPVWWDWLTGGVRGPWVEALSRRAPPRHGCIVTGLERDMRQKGAFSAPSAVHEYAAPLSGEYSETGLG
jgi:hypothetical protein